MKGGRLLQLSALVAALGSPLVAEAGPKVASVYCSADSTAQSDVQAKLQATMLFDKVDNIDMGSSAPTLASLQQYDALLIWADTSRGCSDPTNVGNVLAQYIDAGGGVVQILPYYVNTTYSNVSGDFFSRYSLVNQGSMVNTRSGTIGTKTEAHPTTDGVTTVTEAGSTCYRRNTLSAADLKNGGRIIANWGDSRAMVIVGSPGGHNRVDLNIYVTSADIGYAGCLDSKSDAYKLIGQSLSWTANPLRANPSVADFGDVPAGTTSLPLDFEIKNTGKDAITLSSDSLGMATEFTVKLLGGVTFPVTLNGGDKFTVEATVRPSAAGRRNASYTLSTSTPGASGLVVPLTVNSLGPVFKVDPTQINFGGLPTGGMPRTQTVTIRNAGGGLLNLNSAPTLSDTTNFSIVGAIMPPMSLAAGASVSFTVKFSPTVEKLYSASLSIPYNDGADRSLAVPLTGSFGKPKISVPSSIVMTPVRVNQNGPLQDILVTNSGLADLTISAVAFTGADPGQFLAVTVPTMAAPIVVKPNGGSVNLQVQCNPTGDGLRQAIFNITSDDPLLLGMASTVNLRCNGVTANFNLTPDKLDFTPAQQTGQCTSSKTVTISNSGTDSLRVLSIGFSGPNAKSFQSGVTGARIVASGGGTLNIPVQFCPQDIGSQTADLVLTTDLTPGHNAKVPLTGTGTGPKVVYTPGTVDFGPVYINTKSAAKVIAISNGGDQPLIFGKNSLTPMTGPFTISGLPAEGSKLNMGDPPIMVSVTVAPTMAMQVSADLAIVVNDQVQKGTLHIPLSAVGTQAAVSVQPMMMTFPLTIIGTVSAPQMVTVTNTGMAPLTGIDVNVAGMSSSDFTVNLAGLPMMVMTGQSFQVPVAFRPTAANTRNAIIVVKAAGLPSPVQIATTGTGKLLSITCSPDSKNFGNVPVGDSKVDKITCRNSDSAAIDFVTGFTDFPDDWSIDPTASSISPAMGGDEGVVTLSLTFKPTTTGPRTSTLNIKTKDGILIGTVDLDGNGTTPPKDKTMMNIGCAYSGRTAPTPLALAMFVLAGGLLLRRRRRTA